MRSSRRRLGLKPEFAPSPTPSNSDGSDFRQDFQIKTTLEEEEREKRENEEKALSSEDENAYAQEGEDTLMIELDKEKDIVLSSDSSDDTQSDEIVLVGKEGKSELKKSS